MRSVLLFAFFALVLTACQSGGKPFFVYDDIDHYACNEAEALVDLDAKESKSVLDSLKMEVVSGDIPKDLTDSSFIKDLEQMGLQKRKIDKSRFAAIDGIFREKKVENAEVTACAHFYRDILVFKKDCRVIGIAKICFECGGNQIIGTTANTNNFGQEGDYEKLYKIIRE